MQRQTFKLVFIVAAVLIALSSMIFTHRLVRELSDEEKKKMEIWADATQRLIDDDFNNDISFLLKIIEANTTIPVVILNEIGSVDMSRNIDREREKKNLPIDSALLASKVEKIKRVHEPIIIQLDDDTKQYLYYDDSRLIKNLAYFPYVQLGVIAIFLTIAFIAFASTKRAEQNKVWVGLSKETAHQLGTPISSLLGWVEIFKHKQPTVSLMKEMEKDINRLEVIAERFSKIGSKPELQPVNLKATIENAVQYMRRRASNKVQISTDIQMDENTTIDLNVSLFEWVIENLCKNAIDAMDGEGKIFITVGEDGGKWFVDVQDTGKGVEKNKFKTIFQPGYTTKKRGWGLGLSLVKRIIDYHSGKIFVKQSEIGKGTSFRILLNKEKSC